MASAQRPTACAILSGVVTTPLGMQPWGDYYGKLTDRFGVQWMLNLPIRSRSS